MGAVIHGNTRHSSGLIILIAIAAGLLIGLASFVIKIVVSKLSLSSGFISGVAYNPISYIAALLGLIGFVLFQKSLQLGKVTMITPIMNGVSIIVPVLLAVLFLSEALPTLKLAGILLIVVGIIGLK